MAAERGVLTLCHGPAPYRRLAVTLARCLARHDPGLPRAVATDAPEAPELRRHFDTVIPVDPAAGGGFAQKLHLPRYSPFDRTLFIDADSLVVRALDEVWDAFAGQSFGLVGFMSHGNHWFDAATLPPERRFPEFPVFNSGLLYFEDGAEVFADARAVLEHYDDWRITRVNDGPADEPLFAIAMATAGLPPTGDDRGRLMRTLAGSEGRVVVDPVGGRSGFRKYGDEVSPAVVHFAGGEWRGRLYKRQAARLACRERLSR